MSLLGNALSVTPKYAILGAAQTLTNKTIALGSNTISGTTAEFNAALTDGNFATISGFEELSNKVINLNNTTLYGTTAQFNAALQDGNFATLAGSEILTNKIIQDSVITSPLVSGGIFNTPNIVVEYDGIVQANQTYTTTVKPSISNSIIHSPMASQIWHDTFAFGRAFGYPSQYLYNGTTYEPYTDTTKKLFDQKGIDDAVQLSSTATSIRWLWNNASIETNTPQQWLQINYGTQYGSNGVINVQVHRSPDNFNWYELHNSTYTVSNDPVFHKIIPGYAEKLRITLTWQSGAAINVCSLKYLVSKHGNSVTKSHGNKAYEIPYDWDGLGNITIKSSLSLLNPEPTYATIGYSAPSVKLVAPISFNDSYTLTLPVSTGTTDRLISRTSTDTLTNKTLTALTLRGTLTLGTDVGSPSVGTLGQVLTSTGTGVAWANPTGSGGSAFSLLIGTGLLGAGSSYNGASQVSTGVDQTWLMTFIAGIETPLRNKTLEGAKLTSNLVAGNSSGTSGQVLTSTGTGVVWTTPSGGSGVGTTNFDFGNFARIFTDPVLYMLDKIGMDQGTFDSPTQPSVNLGSI